MYEETAVGCGFKHTKHSTLALHSGYFVLNFLEGWQGKSGFLKVVYSVGTNNQFTCFIGWQC